MVSLIRLSWKRMRCDGGGLGRGGNTVCALCGMTLVEPPFEGCDCFDMIMRNRSLGRGGRRQRPWGTIAAGEEAPTVRSWSALPFLTI